MTVFVLIYTTEKLLSVETILSAYTHKANTRTDTPGTRIRGEHCTDFAKLNLHSVTTSRTGSKLRLETDELGRLIVWVGE